MIPDKENFQHILRVLNTNIDGNHNIMYAITSIKGVGRRFANVAIKKADVDVTKRYVGMIIEMMDRI